MESLRGRFCIGMSNPVERSCMGAGGFRNSSLRSESQSGHQSRIVVPAGFDAAHHAHGSPVRPGRPQFRNLQIRRAGGSGPLLEKGAEILLAGCLECTFEVIKSRYAIKIVAVKPSQSLDKSPVSQFQPQHMKKHQRFPVTHRLAHITVTPAEFSQRKSF